MTHDDYFLVVFDDHNGNIDTEGKNKDGIVCFLKKEKFKCKAGFFGMPWYFVDIRNKFFLPGRPGIAYGKVVGNHSITFEEFKTIYFIYKKYEGLSVLKQPKGVII